MPTSVPRSILRFALVAVILAIFVWPAIASPSGAVRGRNGMVASQHELASQIGVSILKQGGNAVDAAIAVGIALAVVYPEAGNIGGGGFMLIRDAKGEFHSIDYREMAPAAATRDIFVDANGDLIKGEGSSTVGYRASGVPGTLAGFELAYKRFGSGRVSWAELVRPARILAERGFVLSDRLARLFISYADSLGKYPESKRIFLNGGNYFAEGDVLRQPDLARTLSRVERFGAREFYTGQTARLIATDMARNGGLLTLDDLRKYTAKERRPILGTYRGAQIVSMPPPSSGGVALIEMLNILEAYDLRALKYNSAARYHLVAEAMRRAFADRAEFLGDPDFADVPAAGLIEKGYAETRRATIDPTRASDSIKIGAGRPAGAEGNDTTHYSVVDRDGMTVANTYTINDLYGSQVTIKGTGVLMNDEMDDFAARPGRPNMFGLIQGERNSVQPGKRPLSSMTPAIVLRKDGTTWFTVGARGGPRIISAVLQTILNVVDHDMDIQAAIDSPRIHHQWLPDILTYEPYGFSPDTLTVLVAFGHKLPERPAYVASATGIMIDQKGVRIGAIDSRSDGAAIGY